MKGVYVFILTNISEDVVMKEAVTHFNSKKKQQNTNKLPSLTTITYIVT